MPGVIIAMGRLNRPSLMVYGGTIKPGHSAAGAPLDIVSAFQAYGQFVSGTLTEEARFDVVRMEGSRALERDSCVRGEGSSKMRKEGRFDVVRAGGGCVGCVGGLHAGGGHSSIE